MLMNGKDKCAILKQIRRDIAKQNDIALTIAECKHKGDCAGTCPRCEAEVAALERALADRRRQGKKVIVAGISAGLIAANCSSCEPIDRLTGTNHELEGDIRIESTEGDIIIETDETEEYELAGDVPIIEDDLTAPPESEDRQ